MEKIRELEKSVYWVYILECSDGSLYTGIAVDVEKRIQVHNLGKGAKYTRARTPVKLIYKEKVGDRSVATKRELEIKKLSHLEKRKLTVSAILSGEKVNIG